MKVHSIYLFIDICTYCMHLKVYKSVDVNGLMWDVCSVYHHQRIQSLHVSALVSHSFSLQTVCRLPSSWSHWGVVDQIMNWQSVYDWIQMQMVPEPLSRTPNWYRMKHTDLFFFRLFEPRDVQREPVTYRLDVRLEVLVSSQNMAVTPDSLHTECFRPFNMKLNHSD